MCLPLLAWARQLMALLPLALQLMEPLLPWALQLPELPSRLGGGGGRGRRLRLCRRSRTAAERQRRNAAQAALAAQAQEFNRSGRARTSDHLITPPGVRRGRLRGSGMWKVWTPEAVLRAAFMPATQSGRAAAAAVGGAGPGHARACRDVVARCIEVQQQRGLRRLRAEASGSEGRPLKFLIRNCMWDETQLSLKLSGQPLADHSVLA